MQKRNLPYSTLGNWWHLLLAIRNIERRTCTIPNPHLWWYYWKYDDMTSHIKKQNISNCYPLQNYIFLLWWKMIRNNSHVIQSSDIKGTTERAFSQKLTDNSIRQKQQTCKHFEHQQEEQSSLEQPIWTKKRSRSDKQWQCVTHAGLSPTSSACLRFGLSWTCCFADAKRNPPPHLMLGCFPHSFCKLLQFFCGSRAKHSWRRREKASAQQPHKTLAKAEHWNWQGKLPLPSVLLSKSSEISSSN